MVRGNFIGTNPAGTAVAQNECVGVRVLSDSNTIGGLAPADRNLISGTGGCGIDLVIAGDSNLVLNNYIGTDAAGTGTIPSTLGVDISGSATGNTIGGSTPAARNVVSGHSSGFRIRDTGISGNVVAGNYIGVAADGTTPLPNQVGIDVVDGGAATTIGGTAPGAGNLIAFNSLVGILVEADTPTESTGISILGNSIFSNGQLGIDLNDDGITANDTDDPDVGPNELQNFPVLTTASFAAGMTTVAGTLNSTPSTSFRVEIFTSGACDTSGSGEGQLFIGSFDVMTDGGGDASFGPTAFATASPGLFVTATATSANGSTSEFSACLGVSGSPGDLDADAHRHPDRGAHEHADADRYAGDRDGDADRHRRHRDRDGHAHGDSDAHRNTVRRRQRRAAGDPGAVGADVGAARRGAGNARPAERAPGSLSDG